MSDDDVTTLSPRAVSVLFALMILALSLPGAMFGFVEAVDLVFAPRTSGSSQVLIDAGIVIAAGGILSIFTTPIGIVSVWLARRRLRTVPGSVSITVLIMASIGWVLFVLKYVNPFYKG